MSSWTRWRPTLNPRWPMIALPLLLLIGGWGLARAQQDGFEPQSAGPSLCFQGSGTAPYVQPVAYAPSPTYYVKGYPAANGMMDVRVANGSREVSVYVGYVLSFEADYVASSRSTLFVATVSDSRCGPISNIYVRAGQVDDGATAVRHPWVYRSPHATGTFHREICATGSTQTLIVMEGNNPLAPSDPPYVPGQDGRSAPANYSATMQCPTYRWTASGGFTGSGLQTCVSCDQLDGQPCTDPCYRTPGVMRAGQCDLSAATPLCSASAGQYCSLSGTTPRCVSL